MVNNIVSKNGKEFLKISKKYWNSYLRVINNEYSSIYSEKDAVNFCGLKNKYSSWCYSCNSSIGNWNNNCAFIINSINLVKYSYLLEHISDDETNNIFIEIDRNDDKKTI